MNLCRYCGRELPGLEKVCKECFERQYSDLDAPKGKRDWIGLRTLRENTAANETNWLHVPLKFWVAAVLIGVLLYFLSFVFFWAIVFITLTAGLYARYQHWYGRSRISALEITLLVLWTVTFIFRSRLGSALEERLSLVLISLLVLYWLVDIHAA